MSARPPRTLTPTAASHTHMIAVPAVAPDLLETLGQLDLDWGIRTSPTTRSVGQTFVGTKRVEDSSRSVGGYTGNFGPGWIATLRVLHGRKNDWTIHVCVWTCLRYIPYAAINCSEVPERTTRRWLVMYGSFVTQTPCFSAKSRRHLSKRYGPMTMYYACLNSDTLDLR